MTRAEIVEAIREAAAALGTSRLSIPSFRERSGIPQTAVLRHFDSSSEACRAAGVSCGPTAENLVPPPRVSEKLCLPEMQRVASDLGTEQLTTKQFDKLATVSSSAVRRRFGSWQNALDQAGLKSCEKVGRDRVLTADECVRELQRVAGILSARTLTSDEFDAQSAFSAHRVSRACKGWVCALRLAGLDPSPTQLRFIAMEELAADFLTTVVALRRIPTLTQLVNRSSHAADTYSRNHGGYEAFKLAAIRHLLAANTRMDTAVRRIVVSELRRLEADSAVFTPVAASPHRQGATINFRAFKYSPTNESDVVALFGAVAADLGFEILATRAAFPDCQARRLVRTRREHYVDCLIEFEYSSADFKAHQHPLHGCDLIVCWKHNWPQCPLEVLELSSEIQRLSRQHDGPNKGIQTDNASRCR